MCPSKTSVLEIQTAREERSASCTKRSAMTTPNRERLLSGASLQAHGSGEDGRRGDKDGSRNHAVLAECNIDNQGTSYLKPARVRFV